MKLSGYCVQCKTMKEFDMKSYKKNKNGTYIVMGMDDMGHKISKIMSAKDFMAMKK